MKTIKILFLAGPLFFCPDCFAQKSDGAVYLEAAARAAAGQMTEHPQNLPELFDKRFFRHLSLEKLEEMFSDSYRRNGRVTGVRLESRDSAVSAHFIFETENYSDLPAALSIDPDTGRITGLFLKPARKKDPALRKFKEDLGRLDGRTGFVLRRLGGPPAPGAGRIEGLNENEHFAVASSFRLYILGALLAEGAGWKNIFYLEKGGRPGLSGRFRKWPDGAPLTAHTLAVLMLAEDDGAAADLLIAGLGREKIEKDLQKLGHSDPVLMRPFLKTAEMASLRGDSGSALYYLNLPLAEKYKFIEIPAEANPGGAEGQNNPFGIKKLEWFASPADLCRLMEYIHKKADKKALEILAMTPPPDADTGSASDGGVNTGAGPAPGRFSYAGGVRGAGAGVLSTTWLLKDKKNAWYCFSASWNKDKADLDGDGFSELLRAVLRSSWE